MVEKSAVLVIKGLTEKLRTARGKATFTQTGTEPKSAEMKIPLLKIMALSSE